MSVCCRSCHEETGIGLTFMEKFERGHYAEFIVCSICGNKRCPKATNHNLDCTGSNDPGQEGSVYK